MLVSAVMPTRGRREYVWKAVQCFLSQTWEEKELIILDDKDNPSFVTPPEIPGAKYSVLNERCNIPYKRNMVCEMAAGEVIVNFDSDDWSAPGRIARQVEMMRTEKKAVCGFRLMYFWDEVKKQAWVYHGASTYVLGTSLMFRREWWKDHLWDLKLRIGSDNMFTAQANRAKQLAVSSEMQYMVARCHPDNTSPKRFGLAWKKTDKANLPVEFFNEEVEGDGSRSTTAPAHI